MLSDGDVGDEGVDIVFRLFEGISLLLHHGLDNGLRFWDEGEDVVLFLELGAICIFLGLDEVELMNVEELLSEVAEVFSDSDHLDKLLYSEHVFLHFWEQFTQQLFIYYNQDTVFLALTEQSDFFFEESDPVCENGVVKLWYIAGVVEIVDHRIEAYP